MKKLRKNVSKTLRRSSHSSKQTFRKYPHYQDVLAFVERVRRRNPVLVVLFGSVARGDFGRDSDADVLVVFDSPDRLESVYEDCDGGVHPVTKTLDQMDKFIREGEPFYIEMIEDGIPLYDSNGKYEKLSRLARDAKIAWGLKRIPNGWKWTNHEPQWQLVK